MSKICAIRNNEVAFIVFDCNTPEEAANTYKNGPFEFEFMYCPVYVFPGWTLKNGVFEMPDIPSGYYYDEATGQVLPVHFDEGLAMAEEIVNLEYRLSLLELGVN